MLLFCFCFFFKDTIGFWVVTLGMLCKCHLVSRTRKLESCKKSLEPHGKHPITVTRSLRPPNHHLKKASSARPLLDSSLSFKDFYLDTLKMMHFTTTTTTTAAAATTTAAAAAATTTTTTETETEASRFFSHARLRCPEIRNPQQANQARAAAASFSSEELMMTVV